MVDLPELAREYINYVEKELAVPIRWVGVGPERESIIERDVNVTAENVGSAILTSHFTISRFNSPLLNPVELSVSRVDYLIVIPIYYTKTK